MIEAEKSTTAPQQGVHIGFDVAGEIIARATGSQLTKYTESGLGYNNRIYYCQVDDHEQYILKVNGRFWTKIKTETEVAGIQLAYRYTGTPVPVILEWDSSPEKYGHEYLLMSKLSGVSLDHEWPTLDVNEKQDLLDQLAVYISQLHQNICIGSQIGNFAFGPNETYRLGKTVEAYIGPWDSFKDMIINQLEDKINALHRQDKYEFLLRVFGEELTELMRSIKTGETPLPPSPARVFTHGDLNERNIMVTRVEENGVTRLKMVGLLDFEWSGMFPCTEEYFASYEFLNSDPSLKEGFYDELEHHQVATPRTIPHFESHAKLIELREAIAPWWITIDTSTEKQDDCIKQLAAAIQAVKLMPRFE